jgi:hypothetical protein
MPGSVPLKVDMHVHVGVLGDDPEFEKYGAISKWMRTQPVYRVMLLYAKIEPDQASDKVLRDAVLRTIASSGIDHMVCLALDPVFDTDGVMRRERSNMWVGNEYITEVLRPASSGKILLGASVHPYDPMFEERVEQCLENEAVLLKWLPSAQQINLADDKVRSALEFLGRVGRQGHPLPLLLHVGAEYAIMTTDVRTTSYDFLSWEFWDRVGNALRRKRAKWHVPDVPKVLANLRAGLDAGASIILAHCGLPYFAPRFARFLEHSDLAAVERLLHETVASPQRPGKCYADVSACVTPFRKGYFKDIRRLPESLLLAGSDFPVPVFELSANLGENLQDFEAMILRGEVDRILVPEDNLLDVNWRELKHFFGEHAMFRNAERVFHLPDRVTTP